MIFPKIYLFYFYSSHEKDPFEKRRKTRWRNTRGKCRGRRDKSLYLAVALQPSIAIMHSTELIIRACGRPLASSRRSFLPLFGGRGGILAAELPPRETSSAHVDLPRPWRVNERIFRPNHDPLPPDIDPRSINPPSTRTVQNLIARVYTKINLPSIIYS